MRKAKSSKYAEEYNKSNSLIFLESDVAKVFSDTESVNKVLRLPIKKMNLLKR